MRTAATIAMLLLAACNTQNGNEQKSGNGVSGIGATGASNGASATNEGGTAAAATIQPGQWEITTRLISIELPGAPEPQVAELLARERESADQVRSVCVTPEMAANPMVLMRNSDGVDRDCQLSEITFSDGTIRMRATCRSTNGATGQVSAQGSYTATMMEIQSTVQGTAPPGTQGPQTMRASVNATWRRTGDCPAP